MGYPQGEFRKSPGGERQHFGDILFGDHGSSMTSPAWAGASRMGSCVMALDAGKVPDDIKAHPDWKDPAPSIVDAPTLGDGLRAAREVSGRSLAELATVTRVHTRYLTALEQNEFSALPSRVFAIGYVRAYAGALGLDEQLAVERFKRESPDTSTPLQPPVGAAFQEVRRRSPHVLGAVALVLLAVVGWNVFQRVSLMQAPRASDIASVPESWTLGAVPGQENLIRVAAPHPAPPDQTTPVLYVTPGLEAQMAGAEIGPADAAAAAQASAQAPVQAAFNPRGAIYGASATASDVVLQARKAASLVVRMSDGRVLFARQLAAGEAWRAPAGVAATVDVSDPAAFDVYLNGEHGGALTGLLTPLSQLNARAQTLARQAAAEAVAQRARAQEMAAPQPPLPAG